jgi:hypothetical protein
MWQVLRQQVHSHNVSVCKGWFKHTMQHGGSGDDADDSFVRLALIFLGVKHFFIGPQRNMEQKWQPRRSFDEEDRTRQSIIIKKKKAKKKTNTPTSR